MPKVWFITGCSQGFGYVLCKELLEHSNELVVATARNLQNLEERLGGKNKRLLVLKLDVTKQEEIDKAVEKAIEKFRHIDVLVNNAGYLLFGTLEECTMEQIYRQFNTNVFGLMAVTKAVLPTMRKAEKGHIFSISSIAGQVGFPGYGMYASSKFAVEGFSEALALDVKSFGIKVTIIEPGPYRTNVIAAAEITPRHPDYYTKEANESRDFVAHVFDGEVADPRGVAQVIIHIADMDNPPLHLPLGDFAMDAIIDNAETLLAKFKQYEALGRSADCYT